MTSIKTFTRSGPRILLCALTLTVSHQALASLSETYFPASDFEIPAAKRYQRSTDFPFPEMKNDEFAFAEITNFDIEPIEIKTVDTTPSPSSSQRQLENIINSPPKPFAAESSKEILMHAHPKFNYYYHSRPKPEPELRTAPTTPQSNLLQSTNTETSEDEFDWKSFLSEDYQ